MPLSDAGAGSSAQEARLITQIADGNLEEPMQELCQRYEKSLYGFGAHILGDEALAEVMVQEIFQRLWRTAGRFDPASDSPRAFLFGIARSVGAEIRESRPAGAGRSARKSSLPPLPDSVDPILDALAVREAFGTLSAPRAEVLRLALEDGLTQPQIAQRLAVPLDTVTARTLRPGCRERHASACGAWHLPGGWSVRLQVRGLGQLAPGQYYACWYAGSGNKSRHRVLISAGTFSVGPSGSADVSMWTAADLRQFRAMEITAESPGDASQHGRVILSGVARG